MIADKCNLFLVHWQAMFATFIKTLQANTQAVLRLEISQRKLKIITVIAAKRLVPKLMTVSLLTGARLP